MSPVLQRVLRLVALAQSSNENEARNAAMLACRLIAEHDLVISDRGQAPPPAKRGGPRTVRNAHDRETEDMDILQRVAAEIRKNGPKVVVKTLDDLIGEEIDVEAWARVAKDIGRKR